VPYLTCPSCRLTVFSVAGHARADDECPRCGARLRVKPRPLFSRGPARFSKEGKELGEPEQAPYAEPARVEPTDDEPGGR
jgi:hypothetical protein